MKLERRVLALALLAPLLSSCTSMGFPHIGTVDTRHKAPGTHHGQLSFGGGLTAFPPTAFAGANLAFDTHVTPKTSLVTSAHALYGIGSYGEFFPGARIGFRHRPTPRLSLGAAANGTLGLRNPFATGMQYGYGVDLELATSKPLTRERFNSHAWRVAFGVNPKQYQMLTLIGDWSRSIPTSKEHVNFSFGVDYGIFFHNSNSPLVNVDPPVDQEGLFTIDTREPSNNLFIGAHFGFQFGSRLRK